MRGGWECRRRGRQAAVPPHRSWAWPRHAPQPATAQRGAWTGVSSAFDPKKQDSKNAYRGWVAKSELVQDRYSTFAPIDGLVEKVLVSDTQQQPKLGKPRGKDKYFYRYIYDNRKNEMVPPVVAPWEY